MAHSGQRDFFLEGDFQSNKLQMDGCSLSHRLAVREKEVELSQKKSWESQLDPCKNGKNNKKECLSVVL